MARRTYIEETEDPITGEVTILEAESLDELDELAYQGESVAPPKSEGE